MAASHAMSSSVCSQDVAGLSSINCSQELRSQQQMMTQSGQMELPPSPSSAGLRDQSRKKRKVYSNDEERKERRRLSNRLSAKRMRQQRSMAMSQIQEEVYRLRQLCQALHADNQQAMQEFNSLQEENELMQMEISRLETTVGHGGMPCLTGLKGSSTEAGPIHDASIPNLTAWDVSKGKLYQRGKAHGSSPQLQQMTGKPISASERPRALPPKAGPVHITHSMTITPHSRPSSSWQSNGCAKTDLSSDVCSSRTMSASASDSMLPLLARSPTLGNLHHDMNIVKKEQAYSPTLSTPTSWHHDLSHPTIGVLQRTSNPSSINAARNGPSSFSTSTAMDKHHAPLSTSPSLPMEEQVQSGISAGMNMSSNLDSEPFPGAHAKSTSGKTYFDIIACNEVLGPAPTLGMVGSGPNRSNVGSDAMVGNQGMDLCKLEPGSPLTGSQDLSSSYWSDCMPSTLDSMLRPGGPTVSHMDTSSWLLSR